MSGNCVFCNIIAGNSPSHIIYQNKMVLAILDINPVASGHILVIPKEHIEKLHDLKEVEIINALMTTLIEISNNLVLNDFCTDYSIVQSNEKYAEQDINHIHFHIIPRFKDDGVIFKLDKNSEAAIKENLASVANLMTEKL